VGSWTNYNWWCNSTENGLSVQRFAPGRGLARNMMPAAVAPLFQNCMLHTSASLLWKFLFLLRLTCARYYHPHIKFKELSLLPSCLSRNTTVHRNSYSKLKNKNQLDSTYYFIVLLIGSTYFGHYYAHHQELATVMLITTLVVSFLVCCRLEVRCG